ncbi:MAG: DEAD/DEAH box helicase [Hyphomicrobiales bacterium]
MKTFSELGLAETILRAVAAEGYTSPTPIQAEVIPTMSAGRDIVGIAQTGTGKTAAFVLPLLNRLATGTPRPQPRCCGALILAPTRELAAQIAENIRVYGKHTRHSVAVVVGGVRPGPQIRTMARGVDILVATPGRLLDHMTTGAIRLQNTTAVVLDEADQMMDLGFMPAIRNIMAKLPAERQTVLLSATMPAPIRALAQDFLDEPEEISVAPVSRPIERIDQKVMHVDAGAKRDVLVDILARTEVERAIVFTRTKRGADKVAKHLVDAGLEADAIHGNKSQGQRERTLASFKTGNVNILVATDIAARGIDIDDVSHVVNFELPNVPEAYVHRIGRTARAGKSGFAITLCDSSERKLLRDIERLIGNSLWAEGAGGGSSQRARPEGERRNGRPNRNQRNGEEGGNRPRRDNDRRPAALRAEAPVATAAPVARTEPAAPVPASDAFLDLTPVAVEGKREKPRRERQNDRNHERGNDRNKQRRNRRPGEDRQQRTNDASVNEAVEVDLARMLGKAPASEHHRAERSPRHQHGAGETANRDHAGKGGHRHKGRRPDAAHRADAPHRADATHRAEGAHRSDVTHRADGGHRSEDAQRTEGRPQRRQHQHQPHQHGDKTGWGPRRRKRGGETPRTA